MNAAPTLDLTDVPCPFCGLLCDDLGVAIDGTAVRVTTKGCERSRRQFAHPHLSTDTCLVQGKPSSLTTAIEHALGLLRTARRPLLLNAGTDVAGMRALVALAERCGAVIDHANEGLMRNVLAMQDGGWITTTLTEIRNRADFLLCVGSSITDRAPRFFERCVVGGGMFSDTRPRPDVVFMGAAPPAGIEASHIHFAPQDLAQSFRVLRALHRGKSPQATSVALRDLAHRAARASYGVVVWAAADFAFAHAELTVQAICDWLKDLNTHTRFAGLPLGGTDGDITAHQVMTWQTGLPLRTRFTPAGPHYDPHRYAQRHLLANKETDALLCVAEWDAQWLPPPTGCARIVLGRMGRQPPPCEVYIPVGVPGIDCRGQVFRTDNVVAVPLRQLVERGAHSAPDVLQRICKGLQ